MMIFAAATDEKALFVFPSADKAIAYCEGVDVEDGGWMFWDETVAALAPEFFTPHQRGRSSAGSGAYRLVQAPLNSALAGMIAEFNHLETNPHFASFSAVLAHLAAAARAPQHGTDNSSKPNSLRGPT